MSRILPWSPLIRRLRFLMDLDQAQLADHLGVDEPTVHAWERGIIVPERGLQKVIRDELYTMEPEISAKSIEAMPVIGAVHSNTSLALCCAASQPYADPYELRADELRYVMVHHMWNECIDQAVNALAGNEAWKCGECALARATVQRPDGRWVRYAGSPIGTTNMALWIGAFAEKPNHLKEGDFELSVTTIDELLS